MKTNREGAEVMLPGLLTPIKIEPGQFVTGRDSLHRNYHQSDTKPKRYSRKLKPVAITLYRWLDSLSKTQMLHIKKCNKYSIITINNWDIYQGPAHQVHIKCTSNVHKQEEYIYSCEFFPVTEKRHKTYLEAYPNLDLMAEYKAMAAWLESNPTKRKTPRGYPRFINNWLSKAHKEQKGSPDWRDKLKPL